MQVFKFSLSKWSSRRWTFEMSPWTIQIVMNSCVNGFKNVFKWQSSLVESNCHMIFATRPLPGQPALLKKTKEKSLRMNETQFLFYFYPDCTAPARTGALVIHPWQQKHSRSRISEIKQASFLLTLASVLNVTGRATNAGHRRLIALLASIKPKTGHKPCALLHSPVFSVPFHGQLMKIMWQFAGQYRDVPSCNGGGFGCRHVSVAILPPMKWTLSKPHHLESITFDFKHAGTRIKVQTRHMVLINIQSLPVKTADAWEADQSFSGRSMVEWATIKSCEEHSILMYRGAVVPGTFRNVLQIGKGGLLIMDSVVCLFFKTQKVFHGNIIRRTRRSNGKTSQ